MKFLLSLFLFLTVSAFGAVPSYNAFRGTGGISIISNPPTGTIVIDGSGISSPTGGVSSATVTSIVNGISGPWPPWSSLQFNSNGVQRGSPFLTFTNRELALQGNFTVSNTAPTITETSYNPTAGSSPTLVQQHFRGDSTTPTAAQAGDRLGFYEAWGYGDSVGTYGVGLETRANGTWSDLASPGLFTVLVGRFTTFSGKNRAFSVSSIWLTNNVNAVFNSNALYTVSAGNVNSVMVPSDTLGTMVWTQAMSIPNINASVNINAANLNASNNVTFQQGTPTAGKVWTSVDTSGIGSWSNAPAGGGGSGTPGGSNFSVQYNGTNTFGGDVNFQYVPQHTDGDPIPATLMLNYNSITNSMNGYGFGTLSYHNLGLISANATKWEVWTNGHLRPVSSGVYDLGSPTSLIRTGHMVGFYMPTGAQRNQNLKSDSLGYGSWGQPVSGGGGGSNDFVPAGGIQFAVTNTDGTIGSHNDSTNNFVYQRAANEVWVTNSGGTSNTVIGAGYIKTRLLETSNLNVNFLVVSNGMPAFGSDGWVQYAKSGTNKAEAAFSYDDSDDILSVTSVSAVQVTTSNILATAPGSAIKGVTNGASAAAGYIGEYIESAVTNLTAGPSAINTNITTISLTPGDWDVTGIATVARNNATFSSVGIQVAVSPTSGNAFAGEQAGNNASSFSAVAPTTFITLTLATPSVRVSIATNATYYLKCYLDAYTTGGPPQVSGRISARRVR